MISKRFYLTLVLVMALTSNAGLRGADSIFPTPADKSMPSSSFVQPSENILSSGMVFVENAGQFNPRARFQAHTEKDTIWLAEDGIWISVLEHAKAAVDPDLLESKLSENPDCHILSPRCVEPGAHRRGIHLKLSFAGANARPRLEPFRRLDTLVSYFRGSDPAGWRSHVPTWGGVRYLDLYPGIDLELIGQDGQIRPRLLAHPGANLDAVRMRVEGAEGISLEGEHLLLNTPLGEYSLPLLQVVGVQSVVRLLPTLVGNQVMSPFTASSLAAPRSQAGEATSLLYATFLGGSVMDNQWGMTIDSNGSMYLTGTTDSTNFPATPGAFDLSLGGQTDVYVAKLTPNGSGLVYATYLGGNTSYEQSFDVAVDSSGAAYITGDTMSTDFPITSGTYDQTNNGLYADAFIAKLNPNGSSLVFSTYLGGNNYDAGSEIAVDAGGSAYVTGYTKGGAFPTTAGAFDTSYNGDDDVFVVKFNPQGSALLYSTLLGGGGNDSGADIAIDANGAAFITGSTRGGFPTTPGAFDTSFNTCTDAFVTKLNPSGSTLEYSTYLGARGFGGCGPYDTNTGFDGASGIAVDRAGSAYIAGGTTASNFPVTVGAYDPTHNGDVDVFVAKLNPSGSDLLYATFLGDTGWDGAQDIAIDSSGAAYIIGQTLSYHFPTTPGAFDITRVADEAFAAKISPSGATLVYSTYLGGDNYEDGRSIAVDSKGTAYLAGATGSSDFPSTVGSYDPSKNGGTDAFAIKMWMAAAKIDAYIQVPARNSALPGGAADIPIRYGNAGMTTAASPVLTATLHSDLAYLSDTSGITPAQHGQTLVWSLPDLPFSASKQFTLRLRLPASAVSNDHYSVHLEIASSGVEDNPGDNTASLDVVAVYKIFLPLMRQ